MNNCSIIVLAEVPTEILFISSNNPLRLSLNLFVNSQWLKLSDKRSA